MDEQLTNLIAGFTSDGTPLAATIGSKMEWGVVVLTASMLANETLAASMDAEEMVMLLSTITTSFRNVWVIIKGIRHTL